MIMKCVWCYNLYGMLNILMIIMNIHSEQEKQLTHAYMYWSLNLHSVISTENRDGKMVVSPSNARFAPLNALQVDQPAKFNFLKDIQFL